MLALRVQLIGTRDNANNDLVLGSARGESTCCGCGVLGDGQ